MRQSCKEWTGMPKKVVVRVTWLIILVASVTGGCECALQKANDRDTIASELRRLASKPKDPELRRRSAAALSMLENDVMDSRPVLLGAILREYPDGGAAFLRIALYDEDDDAIGICIREEWSAGDIDSKVLIEEYPVLGDEVVPGVFNYILIPVEVRDFGQRKDEEWWQAYVEQEDAGPDSLRESSAQIEAPFVYVSVPEPNDTAVYVHVYDRAGHRSDPVKVVNGIGGD